VHEHRDTTEIGKLQQGRQKEIKKDPRTEWPSTSQNSKQVSLNLEWKLGALSLKKIPLLHISF
jgi:hypothetical protein